MGSSQQWYYFQDILDMVFDELVQQDGDLSHSTLLPYLWGPPRALKDLASCALVAKPFARPAQRQMLRFTYITPSHALSFAKLVIKTPDLAAYVSSLTILAIPSTVAVVTLCSNISRLRFVGGETSVVVSILNLATNILELRLDNIHLTWTESFHTDRPTFKLQRCTFENVQVDQVYMTPILSWLFGSSHQSIQHFTSISISEGLLSRVLNALSSSLRILRVSGYGFSDYVSELATCYRLERCHLIVDWPQCFFAHIPASLRLLSIGSLGTNSDTYNITVQDMYEVLEETEVRMQVERKLVCRNQVETVAGRTGGRIEIFESNLRSYTDADCHVAY